MLDPLTVERRFHQVIDGLSNQSGDRPRLMRMVEFLEVLLETRSIDMILEYAPRLVVRLARALSRVELTIDSIGIADRLNPILWSLLVEYPQVGESGICLAMIRRLEEATTHIEV